MRREEGKSAPPTTVCPPLGLPVQARSHHLAPSSYQGDAAHRSPLPQQLRLLRVLINGPLGLCDKRRLAALTRHFHAEVVALDGALQKSKPSDNGDKESNLDSEALTHIPDELKDKHKRIQSLRKKLGKMEC